jgi:uncharacterized membrane protein
MMPVMNNARNLFLFIAVVLWATIIGGIMYSHLVFLPAYLRNLPASTSLVNGPHAVVDERFWKMFHPLLILSLSLSVILNWKLHQSRKYLLLALGLYAVILVITFLFFVPELQAFAKSADAGLPAAEWIKRGERWEKLSWIRGVFMYVGFGLLLTAFVKSRVEAIV